MLLGLASRASWIDLPAFLSVYAGDTLWAIMIFWLFRTVYPFASILYCSVLPLCFCFAIEFSQLYHAPWIDHIRATKLGGLILGFGFKFSDLLCYFAGVVIAWSLDALLLKSLLRMPKTSA